jgi:HEPN domain-containing protein
MDQKTREKYSSWVSDTFRRSADEYYLAARVLYRAQLDHPFSWCALQAIEKYLKGILLFHLEDVRSYRHDALKAFRRVRRLAGLRFDPPDAVEDFVDYLTFYGADRYLEHSWESDGNELFVLDHSVWQIRRFCRDFLVMPGDAARYPSEERERRLAETWRADTSRPTDFRLEGGWLEQLIEGPTSEQSEALVWKNPCYGRLQRTRLSNYPSRPGWRKPLHLMFPEILPVVEQLVPFRKKILAQIKAELDERTTTNGQPNQAN